ncbi:ABC transporter [Actinobacteria bacterium YIM 96077]|uniref:Transport permease protein n=2 Tax=Phytoactinopolyspora halophila TaxID=1981511 RepID=A0A329QW27_9ACTN|nr:ABC transporter [Actinobacteria bacterium YIM 96077]RAW16515.1 ABC transporter [Phytoactinopolyspora halophila]
MVPFPAGASMARALVERNIRAYRSRWITLVSGLFEPVFYLFSLGVGLGALIGQVDAGGGRMIEYAAYVAPALMAAAAMNGAIFDATFNVFFKLKYTKLYESVLATPLGPRDVAVGEIAWALLRGSLYSTTFLLVVAVSGMARSWWAVLAIPTATLIGFAFASAGMALTTFMRSWQDFEYVNISILPMFLFSATFFPLSTYPEALQWVVQATPLYHGASLVRSLMLGDVGVGLVVHVLYLVMMGLVGITFAARRVERLLLT